MAPAAFATEKKGKKRTETTAAAGNVHLRVNYLGEEGNYILLQVILAKADAKVASLRIFDGLGEELFSERVSDEQYTRLIKVSPDELKDIAIEYNTTSGVLRKKYSLNTTRFTTFRLEEVAIK
ncbi:MAG TPA: hypothetical protein VK907_05540 [Phnomibacter sp.]|nr:hypothetical protein [Phnomibacter sp.]